MSPNRSDSMRSLHSEHSAALWAFTLRLTGGDRTRAEDVVQETLLRAWRSPRSLDGDSGMTRAWLFTVARNLVVDEWRSGRSRHEIPAARLPETATTYEEADVVLQARVVADALRALTPEHRQVLLECFYRGRSVAEAAEALRIPPGTVKSRTHYALRALRLALEEMGALP